MSRNSQLPDFQDTKVFLDTNWPQQCACSSQYKFTRLLQRQSRCTDLNLIFFVISNLAFAHLVLELHQEALKYVHSALAADPANISAYAAQGVLVPCRVPALLKSIRCMAGSGVNHPESITIYLWVQLRHTISLVTLTKPPRLWRRHWTNQVIGLLCGWCAMQRYAQEWHLDHQCRA